MNVNTEAVSRVCSYLNRLDAFEPIRPSEFSPADVPDETWYHGDWCVEADLALRLSSDDLYTGPITHTAGDEKPHLFLDFPPRQAVESANKRFSQLAIDSHGALPADDEQNPTISVRIQPAPDHDDLGLRLLEYSQRLRWMYWRVSGKLHPQVTPNRGFF